MRRIPLFPASRIPDHRGEAEARMEQMLYLYQRREPGLTEPLTHRTTPGTACPPSPGQPALEDTRLSTV